MNLGWKDQSRAIIYQGHEGAKSIGERAGILTLILGLSSNVTVCATASLRDDIVTCYVIKRVEITML